MFVNVSKKSSAGPKFSSNRREKLRGGDPCATESWKNDTISQIFHFILSAEPTDTECSLARREKSRSTKLHSRTVAPSFVFLQPLPGNPGVFIYHPAVLKSLPGKVSKELGKSKEIRKQI